MSDAPNQPLRKTDVSAQATLGAADILTKSSEPSILSIEQLNVYIKQLLEGQVGMVWVKGEISNFKAHSSGHFYFSLKDPKSQITAVMFRGHNSRLKFKPTDGMEVIVRGRITVYEPRGNYQLMCEMMEPVGAGALQKAFEQLKAKLKAEGLFESSRKKAIPTFPRHIAVVTSPTGAAIRDILNVLSRRAKSIQVTVVPTVVQGEGAAPQICEALKKALKLPGVDVVIVGRGGGSIEDMWCFNDETLARLIASSSIPIISAVGHEIDFTIADFVADLRAPTPSAAAELVAKSSGELVNKVKSLERMLHMSFEKKMKHLREKMLGLSKRLVDPKRRLQDLELRNDDLLNRLEFAMNRLLKERSHRVELLTEKLGSPQDLIDEKRKDLQYLKARTEKALLFSIEKKHARMSRLMGILDSLSPLKVVERGYSIVTKNNEVIKSANQVKKGDMIDVRLAQGSLTAVVDSVKGE
ncbi:exodeoxyribonuclease VII large subunit [Bdellovibrio bacteriovorus]|uniref:Exodeoxyribonuclease 7 large subunit n=1 Tax=Bdellovibrio bacteriovorus TaxID=959 RepID=A0A150WCR2_BDEBC|nr:exodeoxyribonuclease VII large subunit [Bdellovibrio bacteriovorus]KYG60681.1 exodeoxyribonuclease VII large subunit [Bdellovibrio bacteriovorus]KYG69118.1 exodeoxyribonuclease VII large subunit [Bdellovibrio bacteriovorus]